MGNFKLSFTTVLFIFSFLLCLVVAFVFVSRAPHDDDDFDADFSSSANSRSRLLRDGSPHGSISHRNNNQLPQQYSPAPSGSPLPNQMAHDLQAKVSEEVNPTQRVTEPPPVPGVQPGSYPASAIPTDTPQAIFTPNPLAGKDPEQALKMLSGHATIPGALRGGQRSNPAASSGNQMSYSRSLPDPSRVSRAPRIQTNDPGTYGSTASSSPPKPFVPGSPDALAADSSYSAGASDASGGSPDGAPSSSANSQSNAGSGWDPTRSQPAGAIVSRGVSRGSSIMISRGKSDPNATPPPGFTEGTPSPANSPSDSMAADGTPADSNSGAPLLYPYGSRPPQQSLAKPTPNRFVSVPTPASPDAATPPPGPTPDFSAEFETPAPKKKGFFRSIFSKLKGSKSDDQ